MGLLGKEVFVLEIVEWSDVSKAHIVRALDMGDDQMF